MTKEYEINDILDAVDSIARIGKKRGSAIEIKNDPVGKDDVLTPNNQEKSDKSEILVLDQMIE